MNLYKTAAIILFLTLLAAESRAQLRLPLPESLLT